MSQSVLDRAASLMEFKAGARRAASRASSKIPGKSPNIKRVRTLAGQERFKQPIGSVIVGDTTLTAMQMHAPRYAGYDRVERMHIPDPRDKSIGKHDIARWITKDKAGKPTEVWGKVHSVNKDGTVNVVWEGHEAETFKPEDFPEVSFIKAKVGTGELYDLGYDREAGKWRAYEADTHNVVREANDEESLFLGLNEQWGGGHAPSIGGSGANGGFNSLTRPARNNVALIAMEAHGHVNTITDNPSEFEGIGSDKLYSILEAYDGDAEGTTMGHGLDEVELYDLLKKWKLEYANGHTLGEDDNHAAVDEVMSLIESSLPALKLGTRRDYDQFIAEHLKAKNAAETTPRQIKLSEVREGNWIQLPDRGPEWWRVRRIGVHSSARMSFDVDQGPNTPIERRKASQVTNREKIMTVKAPPAMATTKPPVAAPKPAVADTAVRKAAAINAMANLLDNSPLNGLTQNQQSFMVSSLRDAADKVGKGEMPESHIDSTVAALQGHSRLRKNQRAQDFLMNIGRVLRGEDPIVTDALRAKPAGHIPEDEMPGAKPAVLPALVPKSEVINGVNVPDFRDPNMDEEDAAVLSRKAAEDMGFKYIDSPYDNFEFYQGPDGQKYEFGWDDPENAVPPRVATDKIIMTREGSWTPVASGDDWREAFWNFLKWDESERQQGRNMVPPASSKLKERAKAGELGPTLQSMTKPPTATVPRTVTAANLEAASAQLEATPEVPAIQQRALGRPKVPKLPRGTERTLAEQRAPVEPAGAAPAAVPQWHVSGLEGQYGLPVSQRMLADAKLGNNKATLSKLNQAIGNPAKHQQVPALVEQLDKELAQKGIGPNEEPRAGIRRWLNEHFTPQTSSVAPTVTAANLEGVSEALMSKPGFREALAAADAYRSPAPTAGGFTGDAPRIAKAEREARQAAQRVTNANAAEAISSTGMKLRVGDDIVESKPQGALGQNVWHVEEILPGGKLRVTTTINGRKMTRKVNANEYQAGTAPIPKADAGEGAGMTPGLAAINEASIVAEQAGAPTISANDISAALFAGHQRQILVQSAEERVAALGNPPEGQTILRQYDRGLLTDEDLQNELAVLEARHASGTTPAPVSAVTEASGAAGKGRRAAARARNAELERIKGTHDMLSEVEQLLDQGADMAILRERFANPAVIEPGQVWGNADPEAFDMLRTAVDLGDPNAIRIAISASTNYHPIGHAGAEVPFNGALHESAVPLPNGAPVRVSRRGAQVEGLKTPLAKAQVTSVLSRDDAKKDRTEMAQAASDLEQQIWDARNDPGALAEAVLYATDPKRGDARYNRQSVSQGVRAAVMNGNTDAPSLIDILRADANKQGLVVGPKAGTEILHDPIHYKPTEGQPRSVDTVRVVAPSYSYGGAPVHRGLVEPVSSAPDVIPARDVPVGLVTPARVPKDRGVVPLPDRPSTFTNTAGGLPKLDRMPVNPPKPIPKRMLTGQKLTVGQHTLLNQADQVGDVGISVPVSGRARDSLVERGFLEEIAPNRYVITPTGKRALDKRNKTELAASADPQRQQYEFTLEHPDAVSRMILEAGGAGIVNDPKRNRLAVNNPDAFLREQAGLIFGADSRNANPALVDYLNRIADNVKKGEWTLAKARDTIRARGQRQNNPWLLALAESLASVINLKIAWESAGRYRDGDFEYKFDRMVHGLIEFKDDQEAAHTGTMIALIPSTVNAVNLALPNQERPDQLHVTLMFLGEADQYDGYTRERIVQAVRNAAIGMRAIVGTSFSASVFNPKGKNPCVVLGIGGKEMAVCHDVLEANVREDARVAPPPDAHAPWVPHMTLAYTKQPEYFLDDVMERTGREILFDRIRIAFGEDDVVDIPLGQYTPPPLQSRLDMMMAAGKQPQNSVTYGRVGNGRENVPREGANNNNDAYAAAGVKSMEDALDEFKAIVRDLEFWGPRGYQLGDTIGSRNRTVSAAGPAPRRDIAKGGVPKGGVPKGNGVKKGDLATDAIRKARIGRVSGGSRVISLDDPNLPPEMKEALSSIYEGRFGNFRSQISWDTSSLVMGNEGSYIDLMGVVYHSDEMDGIGSFQRQLDLGDMSVHNVSIDINEDYQGQRFGDSFYDQSEAELAAHGFDHQYMTANGEVGGYAWAMRDWQWRPETAANAFRTMGDRLDALLAEGDPNLQRDRDQGEWYSVMQAQYKPNKLTPEERMQIVVWRDSFRNAVQSGDMRGVPTPKMIATYGMDGKHYPRYTEMGREFQSWLGKDIMLGASYGAVAPLTVPAQVEDKSGMDLVAWRKAVAGLYDQEEQEWAPGDFYLKKKRDQSALNMLSADVFYEPGASEVKSRLRRVRKESAQYWHARGYSVGDLIKPGGSRRRHGIVLAESDSPDPKVRKREYRLGHNLPTRGPRGVIKLPSMERSNDVPEGYSAHYRVLSNQWNPPYTIASNHEGFHVLKRGKATSTHDSMLAARQHLARVLDKRALRQYRAGREFKAATITPGGRVGDDSHHDFSPRQNWVDKAGGLPRYIRIVRNALVRQGKSEGHATAIAVATMKRWAAGEGNVSAKVKAAAVAALAEWEAKKAKAHASKEIDVLLEMKSIMDGVADYSDIEEKKRVVRKEGEAYWAARGYRLGEVIGSHHDKDAPLVKLPKRMPLMHDKTPKKVVSAANGVSEVASAAGNHRTTRDELAQIVKGNVIDARFFSGGGGNGSITRLVTFEGGAKAVHKEFETLEAARGEYLASRLSEAIVNNPDDAPVPAVIFDNEDLYHVDMHHPERDARSGKSVWVAYVPGVDGFSYAALKASSNEYYGDTVFGNDRAVHLGLLDALTLQRDRNDGNWMMGEGDRLEGIDNEEAFKYEHFTAFDDAGNEVAMPDFRDPNARQYSNRGEFAKYFAAPNNQAVDRNTGRLLTEEEWQDTPEQPLFVWSWEDNPLTQSQAAMIDLKLKDLAPEFRSQRRGYWHEDMMKRWAQIKAHAKGVDVTERTKNFI